MLQSLTVALALPGKQSHTNEEPGLLRGLALQTIDGVAPFTIVADCTAQLLEGITPGSSGCGAGNIGGTAAGLLKHIRRGPRKLRP